MPSDIPETLLPDSRNTRVPGRNSSARPEYKDAVPGSFGRTQLHWCNPARKNEPKLRLQVKQETADRSCILSPKSVERCRNGRWWCTASQETHTSSSALVSDVRPVGIPLRPVQSHAR